MTIDEILRTIAHLILIPSTAFLGVRVWNATTMPAAIQRPVAVFLWLQASLYALVTIELLMARLWQPAPWLFWWNTTINMAQAMTTLYVIRRAMGLRRAAVAVVVALATLVVRGRHG